LSSKNIYSKNYAEKDIFCPFFLLELLEINENIQKVITKTCIDLDNVSFVSNMKKILKSYAQFCVVSAICDAK